MKNFLKLKVWPVIAGLLTAFVIMTLFEYINSFFFPLPEGNNINDIYQLHAFTASLPWTAYILVLLGWIVGAFKAGCVVTYLSKENTYKLSLLTGVILTIFGLFNNLVIGHDVVFNIIALPMFVVFTYLGHKYMKKVFAKRNR
ncbi:MAG: hypothetical protein WC761_02615 [Candidatus Paceibacterota bacterium]|jgi:hypothetical protein